MLNRKCKPPQNQAVKDTLIIIGNGFDLWQGLGTGYSEFRKYYLEHRDEILRKLRIRKKVILDENGQSIQISDVELIYGDPFDPKELDHEFWNTFEASLDKLDAERINLFFGKERKDLREMEKSIRNAERILREAFCGWIATIQIDEKETGFQFGDNCLFINFNYTDTLHKRFRVPEMDEFHIHGEASDRESIIFGHSTHPQMPEKALYGLGGRFRGLYFVERILYETDKHVRDNINFLCMFLAMRGARAEEIRNVYVLGHSMGLPDLEYFAFLTRATSVQDPEEEKGDGTEGPEVRDPLDELDLRLQYAINHGGYGLDDEQIDPEQENAVAERFQLEQEARDREFQKEFMKMVKRGNRRSGTGPAEAAEGKPRTEDAMWHISCRSERSRLWAEHVMRELGCKNFKLYPTIDECLEPFRK